MKKMKLEYYDISSVKIQKIKSKSNRNQGTFMKYLNTTNIDWSMYRIFDSFMIKVTNEGTNKAKTQTREELPDCDVIYALKMAGSKSEYSQAPNQ
jgi:hypothetical protein